ncbi:hypothetical protein DXG01_002442 [Tephrocybe rancida]|nr:hypothetical protein DXG01_002442 [Tephrocybe rancida]
MGSSTLVLPLTDLRIPLFLPFEYAVSSAHEPPPDPQHYDSHRRMFLGPMPEKVISQTEATLKKQRPRPGLFRSNSRGGEDADDISEIIKQNAFSFFIREGGRPEDWGEDEERNVVEEMFKRWRSSEWANIWRHRRETKTASVATRQTNNWVGGSFEIGRFLGVNILQDSDAIRDMASMAGSSARRMPLSSARVSADWPRTSTSMSFGRETFLSASTSLHPGNGHSDTEGSAGPGDSHYASSSTSLLRPTQERINGGPKAHTEFALPGPALAEVPPAQVQSDDIVASGRKGKGRLVHYADQAMEDDEETAPPSEVLERTGHESLQDTSAGAAAKATLGSPSSANLDWGEVIMRDRMLVRTCYSKSDNISPRFDEQQHRTTQHLLDNDLAEYLVAWRKDRIELYTDHNIPGKEWYIGHKHLAFVIPLTSPRTQLSLYSFVDLAFCITCEPTKIVREGSKKRFFLRRARDGTNIFIFKQKSRSRAFDWLWLLWRQLGGELPSTIDVRNPRVATKVKIDIPPGDADRLSRVFSRENVIALCMNALASVPDWKRLIEREMQEGKTLELAWRQESYLDWVWLDDDVDGYERRWAVLCGLALKQSSRPPTLEIRLADHSPTYIHLKNGSRLHEPPAIEGYVERIRPNSQMRQNLYLATHDGNLFVMTPNHAYPPSPPGLAPNIGDVEAFAESLRKSEVNRGAKQIMHAIGVNDLRTVLLIRRASHPAPEAMHKEASKSQDSDIWASIWAQSEERTPADEADEGGEEGLKKAEDKVHLKMRRSFELLLTTGHVVRFETHSCRVASEWIERLRALVLYWKQRHRTDAKEEMDLAQSRRPRLTPLTRVVQDEEFPPDPPPDMGAPMPALGSLYSWCVIEGCKSIVKGGKLFVRKGLFGQYKLVQLFLTAGHLTQFRIKPKSSLHQTMHRTASLADAYVCSGYLAAMTLPKGQYRADVNADPRRYQDGLETNDPEEEMLFMIWYHPQALKLDNSAQVEPQTSSKKLKAIPPLSGKRKLLVCRTRSRLERDAWCWALNCEIEKLVRAQKEREAKLREAGSLVPS